MKSLNGRRICNLPVTVYFGKNFLQSNGYELLQRPLTEVLEDKHSTLTKIQLFIILDRDEM